MGRDGADEHEDRLTILSLDVKQRLLSRSLHPIPCPSCLQTEQQKQKAKASVLLLKVCLHFYPVRQLWEAQTPAPSSRPAALHAARPRGEDEVGKRLPLPGWSNANGNGSVQEQQQPRVCLLRELLNLVVLESSERCSHGQQSVRG